MDFDGRRKMNSIIRTASRIIGTRLDSLEKIYYNRLKKRTNAISADVFNLSSNLFQLLLFKK